MDTKRWNIYQSVNRKIETRGQGVDKTNQGTAQEQVAAFQTYVNYLKQHAPPDTYPLLLDVGAGNGAESKALEQAGYKVVALGFGDENIKYAKDNFNIEMKDLDMHDLSTVFRPEEFNLAVLIHTFEHTISPFILLGELYYVLKVGGIIMVEVPSFNDLSMRTIWHTNLMYPDQISYYFKYWGFKEMLQSAEPLGYESRHPFLFRKMSHNDPEFKDNYGYLHWILDQLGQERKRFFTLTGE